jgi:hypothetical protein
LTLKTTIFLLIISFVYIFKEGIIMDHWNVFMMKREENDLGEMGPSSLAEAGPNNLGGAGPSGIGGVEPTKKYKKRRSGS